jgi:hypothetical protein
VRIIVLACTLAGVAVALQPDPAEARTRQQESRSWQNARHHPGISARHTRKSYAHKAATKSYAHKSAAKSYAHKSKPKSYARKSSETKSARIQVKATASARVGPRPARWCGWWMRTQ